MLHQLIYSSQIRRGHTATEVIPDILSKSERSNRHLGVTGYLIFDTRTFLQVLEGEAVAIDKIFSRICQDTRHEDIRVQSQRGITTRAFGDWDMGGYIRAAEVEHIYKTHNIGGTEYTTGHADNIIALARSLADWKRAHRLRPGEPLVNYG